MRLDLAYQAQASRALDLWILSRTVGAVVSGRGAYGRAGPALAKIASSTAWLFCASSSGQG